MVYLPTDSQYPSRADDGTGVTAAQSAERFVYEVGDYTMSLSQAGLTGHAGFTA